MEPDVSAVRSYILDTLRDAPTGASTRFTLAEGWLDRYPGVDRDGARSTISRALSVLQDAGDIAILRSEAWDLSGDERVRLRAR